MLARREWRAYPRFSPPESFASFVPVADELIYYVNAIETGVSAMEVCVCVCVRVCVCAPVRAVT